MMDIQAEQAREDRANNNNNRGGNRGEGRGPPSRRSTGGSGGNFHRNSSGSGGGGRRGGNNRRPPDRSNLPLEHGCICSAKDKFGFIHCADRPTEIFFHYSEVTNVNPDDLNVDDEVEFRVGKSRDNPDKLAAFEVYRLPTGTVQWEYEESPGERFQGLVDRPLMRPSGNNNRRNSDRDDTNVEGSISLLVPAEESKETKGDKKKSKDKKKDVADAETMTASEGPKIRFTANDYNPDSDDVASTDGDGAGGLRRKSSNTSMESSNRLLRGDLVEFTLVVEKRTRQKFARNIVVLQSERERARLAKEKQMMANATLEQGVVVSLKQDFGFLRSSSRREEVYFHYSYVHLPEEGEDEHELQIGQDMEFLVVTEDVEDRSNNRKQKTSARQVNFLPKGTVVFDKLIAEGVTGMISIVPRADAGRNQQKGASDPQSMGSVRLSTPLSVTDPGTKEAADVKTVVLHVDDVPGGLFAVGKGASMGLWIREGDKVLFDVVYDFVDGKYHARPTKHLVPVGSPLVEKTLSTEVKENSVDKEQEGGKEVINGGNGGRSKKEKKKAGIAVRLVELSLAGRAEGTINTIKEAYGFIHFAERPVDVHFKQFELLPDDVQQDLRRNMGVAMTTTTKADMMGFHQLSPGMEVQFDMSIQGTVMTPNQHQPRGNKRNGGPQSNQHERENLKAQRMLILPKGTILQNKTLGLGLKGTVTKEDPNQPYAGSLDLAEELPQLSLEERHPLVVKMLDSFLRDDTAGSLVFPDIQSSKEEDVIELAIDNIAKGLLEMTHIPQAGNSSYAGRLCIRKVSAEVKAEAALEPESEVAQAAGAETTETKEDGKGEPNEEEKESPKRESRSKSPKPGGAERSKSPKALAKKKKAMQLKLQPLKTIRYDKSSLTPGAKTEVPPGAGDETICDVRQVRRTGKVHLENLSVTDRKVMDPSEVATMEGVTGVGVVREVVLASKFGFITVADEAASKRELLFFHFASVISQNKENPSQQSNHGRSKKGAADAVIHKGDEVKFKIGTEKNGKRVAVDIEIVSLGAIVPSKADKNACKGYILVEPTDTKVGTGIRPSRSFNRGKEAPQPNGGGRWNNVKDLDTPIDQLRSKGEGVILLLEDPSNMFASLIDKVVKGDADGKEGAEAKEEEPKVPSSLAGLGKFHLHYQNGGLALHGAGAPTTMDSSTNPRRGDLVSFVKSKGNGDGVRDIRVVTRAAATLVRGNLQAVDQQKQTAKFVGSVGGDIKEYEIDLKEVVSCEPKQLKDQIEVEGIFHGEAIHGICRASDLRLETKLGTGRKERAKLNLAVKKDKKGQIMAQSMMAKVSDGDEK